mmetsp:Transcript_76251/g.223533  ORF Transcript_76251/g.223533 Transcript_76251/m.223533 type:complete len:117 (-) Transcript_76251:980-1330(-)
MSGPRRSLLRSVMAVGASTEPNGSSMRSTSELLWYAARAMATLAFWPPESVPSFCFAMPPNPKLARYPNRNSSFATFERVVLGSWPGSRGGKTPRIHSTHVSVRWSSSLSRWCCET